MNIARMIAAVACHPSLSYGTLMGRHGPCTTGAMLLEVGVPEWAVSGRAPLDITVVEAQYVSDQANARWEQGYGLPVTAQTAFIQFNDKCAPRWLPYGYSIREQVLSLLRWLSTQWDATDQARVSTPERKERWLRRCITVYTAATEIEMRAKHGPPAPRWDERLDEDMLADTLYLLGKSLAEQMFGTIASEVVLAVPPAPALVPPVVPPCTVGLGEGRLPPQGQDAGTIEQLLAEITPVPAGVC